MGAHRMMPLWRRGRIIFLFFTCYNKPIHIPHQPFPVRLRPWRLGWSRAAAYCPVRIHPRHGLNHPVPRLFLHGRGALLGLLRRYLGIRGVAGVVPLSLLFLSPRSTVPEGPPRLESLIGSFCNNVITLRHAVLNEFPGTGRPRVLFQELLGFLLANGDNLGPVVFGFGSMGRHYVDCGKVVYTIVHHEVNNLDSHKFFVHEGF